MSQPHRITVLCPAKVNLGLEVLRRRDDGFHDICTVMQSIDLYDELTVEVGRGGPSRPPAVDESTRAGATAGPYPEIEAPEVRLSGPFASEVPAEGNSVLAAWAVAGGVNMPQVTVRLVKRIPAGAGLGGGSSDAAGMLMAMREVARLVGTHVSVSAVGTPVRASADSEPTITRPDVRATAVSLTADPTTQALRIGSDAPFFLRGGCQLAQGRGEQLSPIDQLDFHLLLAVPRFSSATPRAYAALGRGSVPRAPMLVPMLARGLRDGDWHAVAASLVNDFAPYLLAAHPEYHGWFDALEASGAAAVSHTGSGSGFYGLFRDAQAADRARTQLGARGELRYLGVHKPLRF